MQKHRSWQEPFETEWQEVCRREAVIRSLIEAGPIGHTCADVVAKDLGISRSLVFSSGLRFSFKKEIVLVVRFAAHGGDNAR